MTVIEIVILVAVLVLIGVLYAVVQSERKKGAPLCGRACGGCPHPCHSDGTPKEPPYGGPTRTADEEASSVHPDTKPPQ